MAIAYEWALQVGRYYVGHSSTVRETAQVFDVPKSRVYRALIRVVIPRGPRPLARKVKAQLRRNRKRRASPGPRRDRGEATSDAR